ncbi:MAG: glycosyltransferase family 4 protein, partial [Thaumarchaeota archaeon]|nr:glycosyltransferase family 4 protein [Nitrososphaerota archaeon]
KFELIHVQAPPYGPFIEGIKRPFVVTVHSPLSEEMKFRHGWRKLKMRVWRRMEARTLKHADAVIAVSDFTRRCLVERSECDPQKIEVIPNGVDLEAFRPDKHNHSLPSLMVCSRPDPRKNLALTGEATDYAKGRVRVFSALGGTPRKAVETSFREADIFLTTSFSEGFNLTLLEGMASGCACLASDIPAHRELIDNGRDGMLFSDDASMKRLLDMAIADPNLRRMLGDAARRKAEEYPWSKTAKETLEVYRKVIS